MSYAHVKPGEECGVFGIRSDCNDAHNAANICHTALYGLQHRGQEACGIAANDQGVLSLYKGPGLVSEVFNQKQLDSLHGDAAIAHVRYCAGSPNNWQNAQPLVVSHIKGNLAVAFNGKITNAPSLKSSLEKSGSIFQTGSDIEIIANLIVFERLSAVSMEIAVSRAAAKLRGAFCIVLMSPRKLIALRDPHGFRPLCMGKLKNSVVFSSESCAFDTIGAKLVRDIAPGELVLSGPDGLVSMFFAEPENKSSFCAFEYVYFLRPDSIADGLNVDLARQRMGALLAIEHPVQADIVVGVPDSGLNAAIGYSKQSGIPYTIGLVKNRYITRTFIKPTQSERINQVKLKLNALSSEVCGKSVILVDDSIVRGTTSGHIVSLLREAGATAVHMRISSPPFVAPCYYGTDVPDKSMLIASSRDLKDITQAIGADSLGYLSINALNEISKSSCLGFCTSCFGTPYPVLPESEQE